MGALPVAAVEPEHLPFGLVKTERSTPAADRLELLSHKEARTAILLAESATGAAPPEVPAAEAGQAVITAGGPAVLVPNDPRPRAVAGALGDRRGVRFALLVTEAPAGGIALTDLRQIVEALAPARDAAVP